MATKKAAPKKAAKVTKPAAKPRAPRKVAEPVKAKPDPNGDVALSQARQLRNRVNGYLGNYIEPELTGNALADAVAINQATLDALTL